MGSDGSEQHGGSRGPQLGDRLRSARERAGWSREELASRSGLSWSAVEQIESGRRRNARPGTLEALSRALGVSIDQLVRGGPSPMMLDHQLLVYPDADSFVAATGPFIRDGLERSERVMTVTTDSNIEALHGYLGSDASDVTFVEAETWYRAPGTVLGGFLRFLDGQLAKGSPWTRIVGEPHWWGRSQDEIRVTHQYESLFNLVFGSLPASFLCAYDERALDPAIVTAARATHPRLMERGNVVDNVSYQDPASFLLGSGDAADH